MNTARVRDRLLAMRSEVDELLQEIEADGGAEPKPLPRVMKIKQYAAHRSCGERTVYKWIGLGLPVERRGKITRVIVSEADKWNESAAIARSAELAASGGKS